MPSNMLYEKELSCLFCQSVFITKKVRSAAQPVETRDADFCTYFRDQRYNPIVYTVYVCPHCGFSFTEQFSPVFTPQSRLKIEQQIASRWVPKTFADERNLSEAMAAYKLAIFAAELKEETHSVKAGLYLRLAWLNRFIQADREEARFLRVAAAEYEQSYLQSDFGTHDKQMTEVRLLYLIGELNRRIGRYDQAITYYGKTLEHKETTIETGILQMAREQWQLTRQEHLAARQESEQ
ncbi:DUF2225 domain-containing protein [Brevibacillus fulvus]|uniref:Uncharacterized protein (DUF2225 family) n=1 Tax=Brevibacillus fulvus TaxID=1125967 RepID=A0A939BP69_9BACL|nr:DUF2225 domain-containing protein [Brevibacillus fulvus]MBM7590115.1 uncharacterized protein (DUF2225 family) [Brevibacillus fulvus]